MELRALIQLARKYLWLIALTALIGGGVAFYVASSAPPVYRATTTLEIHSRTDPLTDPYSYYSGYTVTRLAESLSVKATFAPVLEKVRNRLGIEGALGGSFKVARVGETSFVQITAEARDPALAQALANTLAEVLIENETEQQQARFREGMVDLEAQIESLEERIAATRMQIALFDETTGASDDLARQELADLQSQLNRDETRLVVMLQSAEEFRLTMARYTDFISVYAPAEMPGAATQPEYLQNTLLGIASGLIIGGSIAFLLEYLDDTVKTSGDVKHGLQVGLLAALPRMGEPNGRLPTLEHPLAPVSEAFRNLRTSVQFADVDRNLRTLLVTSASPTDGKTFVAANLAAIMAQGGKRVILVDADLRRPRVHKVLDLPREPGLTDALLSGGDRYAEVLRETELEGLRVVTCGAATHNPVEILSSQAYRKFVTWLSEQADVVLFDSPPILAMADAAVLSNIVDGTLLVLNSGDTRLGAAQQALERVRDVEGTLLGVVLNRVPASADGYHNRYYYYYADSGNGSNDELREAPWPTRLLRRIRGRR